MSETVSIVTDYAFNPEDQHLLRETAGTAARLEIVRDVAALRLALPTAIVLCTARPPSDLMALAPHLRWFQYPVTGIDDLVKKGVFATKPTFQVTTVNMANAQATAEYVLGAMLVFARNWGDMLRLQAQKVWAEGKQRSELRGFQWQGRTLGIVGLGAVGRRVAQLGRALGMRVLGMRRTSPPGVDPDCDALYATDQLPELLGESDCVLISVPLTKQTHGMIGTNELHAMRPNAFLINVARGEVIQESALIRALSERRIAGAALDVAESEPLPRTSPLWSLPGMLLTPHISGLTTGYTHRVAQHFAANISRFLHDEPLVDAVDFDAEY
jgi:phosphoglycerate dehydrogenase-like enzyme